MKVFQSVLTSILQKSLFLQIILFFIHHYQRLKTPKNWIIKSFFQGEKYPNNMESILPPSESGLSMESSSTSKRTEESVFTPVEILKPYSLPKKAKQSSSQKRKRSVTPESAAITNEAILKDRSTISKLNSQNMKSYQTSDLVSIGNGKDYFPYWNKSTKEMSEKLLLPTKIDSLALESNCWNGSLKRLGLKCWFSTTRTAKKMSADQVNKNSQKISSQSLPCSSQKIMDAVHQKIVERELLSSQEEKKKPKKKKQKSKKPKKTDKLPAAQSDKIRLYPNFEEKQKLNLWFGAARWTYNQCLIGIKNHDIPRNKKALRSYCVNENSDFRRKPKLRWLKDIPYDIKDEAMNDLLKAFDTCFSLLGTYQKHFDIKLRKKKLCSSESIVIHAKHWKHKRGEFAFLKQIKACQQLPSKLDYDARLVLEKPGHYYLCVPKPLSIASENQGGNTERKMASIDPGVRTFATVYDTTGTVTEWGKGDISRIFRLCVATDRLISKIDKEPNHSKRWSKRKALNRIRKKIKNLQTDIHHKFAKWLCEEYEVILLPKFDAQGMCQKWKNGKKRVINRKTVRKMFSWGHYQFRMRLLDKIKKYPGKKVVIVDEAYTSKTCVNCGRIHEKLGGNKNFCCPSCKIRYDRDFGAAKGIMLRFLSIEHRCETLCVEA